MTKQTPPRLVTFQTWANDANSGKPTPVSVNPAEVSDIEDYCGTQRPGQKITLKNKKTYLVAGEHAEVVAKLTGET